MRKNSKKTHFCMFAISGQRRSFKNSHNLYK